MNGIRFRMAPPPGTAARLNEEGAARHSEEEQDASRRSGRNIAGRIWGGTAARLHERAEAVAPSPRLPSTTGFALRAQGGRITRSEIPPLSQAQLSPEERDRVGMSRSATSSPTVRAAQTAAEGAGDGPSVSREDAPLLSWIHRVHAMLRRS